MRFYSDSNEEAKKALKLLPVCHTTHHSNYHEPKTTQEREGTAGVRNPKGQACRIPGGPGRPPRRKIRESRDAQSRMGTRESNLC
jgi:hypothetical protein